MEQVMRMVGKGPLTEQEFVRALPEIKSRALRFARIQGICHVSCIQVTHFDSVSKKCRQEHVVFEGEVFGQH